MIGLRRADGSLEENPTKACLVSIFRIYILLTACWIHAYFRVVPNNISTSDQDNLDEDFMKEAFFAALSSMQNGKSPRIDGLPCEFYKAM